MIDIKAIGSRLKERREELGYSIEDIHQKTKLSIVHIQAIESGNMDYFKHDLSYLKFFLQYYCQAVYLNYDEIKDEYDAVLNDYTQTQLLLKQERKNESNENIRRRVEETRLAAGMNKKDPALKINYKKLFVALLMALIGILILLGLIKVIKPLLSSQQQNIESEVITIPKEASEKKPNTSTDSTNKNTQTPTVSTTPVESVAKVKLINPYEYQIETTQKTTSLKVVFHRDTWIQVYVNEAKTNNPVSQIYRKGQEIEMKIDDKIQSLMLHMGIMKDNEVFVDNKKVDLDSNVAKRTSGTKIVFKIKEMK